VLIDMKNRKALAVHTEPIGIHADIKCMAVRPDEVQIALGMHHVQFVRLEPDGSFTMQGRVDYSTNYARECQALAYSPCSRWLVAAHHHSCSIVDVAASIILRTVDVHRGVVGQVFVVTSQHSASSEDEVAAMWDGEAARAKDREVKWDVISCSSDGTVRRWPLLEA